MLSIAIPSRNERFLRQTIQSVLDNAKGEIEVFPVLDGYEPPASELVIDPRVRYIRFPSVKHTQKRQAINYVADISSGEYLMLLDAHCMVGPGFDVALLEGHQDNWVSIPRRNRLDAENWCLQDQVDARPPIDYEYTMFPLRFDPPGLHGFKWDARTWERQDIEVDDTMHIQGSCWLMHKFWFRELGLMQVEGYSGWGQEGECIVMKTKLHGGRVITNKRTWYAHLHKGPKYGRMYYMSRESMRQCVRYSYQTWVHEHRDLFARHVESFWPVPGWPTDWKKQLWT